jgi:propionate CoA-transferase
VVNLGIGMPEGVAAVAAEEKVIDLITLTAEPGVIGGIRLGASTSAPPSTPRPSSTSPASSTSTTAAAWTCLPGPGPGRRRGQPQRQPLRAQGGRRGRLHQHQPERQKVVFVGTFTAGKLELAVAHGQLTITHEGGSPKFVAQVEHRTFSGRHAAERGQPVLYVTERCVFQLTPEGWS